MKKEQVWFADNYGAWVPDEVVEPHRSFSYRAARGTAHLVVAFDGIVPVGWVLTEKLGYPDAKAWSEANP